MGAREVAGEDGGAEAVGGVVGAGDGFVFGGEGGDGDEGAEDLFAGDGHGGGHVGEDGGGDEEPFAVADVLVGFAAGQQCGAFALSGLDVVEYTLVLGFGHLGPLEGGFGEGIADFADFFEGGVER